jgi:dTMP kinase
MSRFLVLEGLDGAGTTTQAEILRAWLESRGHATLSTREPTDGPIGRVIRQVLRADPGAPDPRTLPWLFAADRADHLTRTVEPALAEGTIVLSDRYYHSSLAYQSLTMPLERVHALNAGFRAPDLTLFLDVPVDVCLDRIARRAAKTGEKTEIFEVRERLIQIDASYRVVLDLLRARGEPIAVLDGCEPPERVAAAIREAVDGIQ